MADQIYLSYWLRNHVPLNMMHSFEKALKAFPFSRLAKSPVVLRVSAVSFSEATLHEQVFESVPDIVAVVDAASHFSAADAAFELEAAWDLWQDPPEYKLAPARAIVQCFGTEFSTAAGEHLRIDCGPDTLFLPDPQIASSARIIESNLRSLLKLSHDLDEALRPQRRQLWTESGENFADRLKHVVS